jgi:uncharacterized protein (DUF433 family)
MVTLHRTAQEKADLIAKYIAPNPHKAGIYNAIIEPYGVSVWVIIARFEAVNGGNIDEAAAEYDLPHEAVEAALAYYERHGPAIDAKIEEMHAQFEERPIRGSFGLDSEAAVMDAPHDEEDDGISEEQPRQIREDPRVIIHRRRTDIPFEPFVHVVGGDIDALDLLERRDAEGDGERQHS